MSFWDSKFVKDLETGKLPEVQTKVEFESSGLINLMAALLITGIALIFISKIIKKV